MHKPFMLHANDTAPSERQSAAISALKQRCERHATATGARNGGLLQMLERIDYQAATLAAKTEQLKLLKVSARGCGGGRWRATHRLRKAAVAAACEPLR